MKGLLATMILVALVTACVGGQKKSIDMTNAGVIRVNLSILDYTNHQKMNPDKIYFIRLNSPDNYQSTIIIASDRVDAEGYIYINPQPGLYAIVGADRYVGSTLTRTIFDPSAIKASLTELAAGETKTLDLRILDYHKTIFADMDKDLIYYHGVLKPKKKIDLFEFKIGKHFPAGGANRKKASDGTDKKEEKPEIIIENY